MNVLMIAPGYSIHSQRTVNLLLENGCTVTFVDKNDPYPAGREKYRFIPYPHPRGSRYYNKLGEKATSSLAFWTVVMQLRLIWRRVMPDVVHVLWVDRRAYHCVRAGLRPLVLSVWGSDVNLQILPDAHAETRKVVGEALSGADLVIAESLAMAERCCLLADREVNTRVLKLGVNTELFRPGYQDAALEWRRRLAVPEDSKVLLSPRGWARHYNHHLILEAFSQALSRLKANAILVFLVFNQGTYPEGIAYEKELLSRTQELGIAEWVRWMNEVPMVNLPEVYAFADVVINFPVMDSLSFTILEAAACERPVITARLQSYQGIFAEKYFRMVEPGNIPALADAIVETLNQESAERVNMLSEARRVVAHEYNESNTIARLLRLYGELAHRRGG